MHQVQILLPVSDNKGNHFPSELYADIRNELVEKYGGITAYTRSPAKGLWKENNEKVVYDDIVIYEVMAETLEMDFWRLLKEELKRKFDQDDLIIRVTEILIV